MKIILLFLGLTVFQSSKSQTKQETIDWLNAKFGDDQTVYNNTDNWTAVQFLKINNDGSFNIKSTDFIYNKSTNTSTKFIDVITGNFKDISINSFKVVKIKGSSFLQFSCTKGKCIHQVSFKGDTEIIDNQRTIDKLNNSVAVAIIQDDNELIQRAKKAFLHLIKLCGGKKEAF